MRLAWVALVATIGCYHGVPGEGAPCSATTECPAPLTCIANACSSGGAVDVAAHDTAFDAQDVCTCTGSSLSCNLSGDSQCALGCRSDGLTCAQVLPSNGIPTSDLDGATANAAVSGNQTTTVFDDVTGEITGEITRAAGTGVIDGIGYYQHTDSAGTNTLGEFAMSSLTITGTAQVVGTHSVVFLVAHDVAIGGLLDVSGGCVGGGPGCAGPGAGPGGTYPTAAGGCGAGGTGASDSGTGADTGGGGGGYGGAGAVGGIETASSTPFPGGTAGRACAIATLEPLLGGSGGGGGGPGSGTAVSGGGGGGAIQISALGTISIAGAINAGGAGGSPGPTSATNAGAGGGGGSGGAILLEALAVQVGGTLAANGGGGGGSSDHMNAGTAGAGGGASAVPALAGTAGGSAGASGNGGTRSAAPQPGAPATNVNAGAGGGGVGAIYLRGAGGSSVTMAGTISPAPGIGSVRSQ